MIEVEWTVLFARLFSQADADTRAHISAHLRGLTAGRQDAQAGGADCGTATLE